MTEFGNVNRTVDALLEKISQQKLLERCERSEWSGGTEREICELTDTWSKENILPRLDKLQQRSTYGDKMKAKIAILATNTSQLSSHLKRLAAWSKLCVASEVAQTPLPHALSTWRNIPPNCPEARLTDVSYQFQRDRPTEGTLLIRGPKYTAYYGHRWELPIDLVAADVNTKELPGVIVEAIRGVPWRGEGGGVSLMVFVKGCVEAMNAPLTRVQEQVVRRMAAGCAPYMEERRRFAVLALSMKRRGFPAPLVAIVYEFGEAAESQLVAVP